MNASNNEMARYVYYTGFVRALMFDYEAAEQSAAQALQKAPQHPSCAMGFKQAASADPTSASEYHVHLSGDEIASDRTYAHGRNSRALHLPQSNHEERTQTVHVHCQRCVGQYSRTNS